MYVFSVRSEILPAKITDVFSLFWFLISSGIGVISTPNRLSGSKTSYLSTGFGFGSELTNSSSCFKSMVSSICIDSSLISSTLNSAIKFFKIPNLHVYVFIYMYVLLEGNLVRYSGKAKKKTVKL